MSLLDTDTIVIPAEAVAFIERREQREAAPLAKYEVIEFFFEWLRHQAPAYQVAFLRLALSESDWDGRKR